MCQRFQWGHHDLYLHPNLSWVGAEPDKTNRAWVGLTRSYGFQPCILLSWSVDIFLIYWINIYKQTSWIIWVWRVPSKATWWSSSGLCFLCVRKECHLWRATQLIFCAGGQQSVWYLPQVLCQRAINRFKGSSSIPQPPTLPPTYTAHLQLGALLHCCAHWKGNGAVSHDAVFWWEEPSMVRDCAHSPQAIELIFHFQKYKKKAFQHTVDW